MPGSVPGPVTQINKAEKACSWTLHSSVLANKQLIKIIPYSDKCYGEIKRKLRVLCGGGHFSRAVV